MVVTAIALGLAPLLHWRLTEAKMTLPPLAAAKLAVTRQAHAKRNEAIGQQLTELLTGFALQKIDVLVLKGALLAATVYPEAALRPMNDIDLLFRAEDLPSVGPVLESLGYQGKHKSAEQGPGITKHLSTYRREGRQGDTPNPYLSAGGERMVEPHGLLEEAWFGLKVDITPGVWARAMPVSLCGQPAYRLSTSDMILHLTVHAAFHVIMGASVFVQLYDIGRVIEIWAAELNWNEILSLTRQAKAQAFVFAGLYWAKTLYGAAISEESLATLAKECPPDLAAYVRSLDGPGIFRRTQHPPLTTVPQRLRRGLADRQEAARWAGSWGEKWQIWQTALAFHKTDTAGLLKKGRKSASADAPNPDSGGMADSRCIAGFYHQAVAFCFIGPAAG
ncbi:MAG: nucleotidyltransferase family protein [Anaerolineales bacterium]|nr:nucleotidyltransferase family protein [Anaerolineales bacterium]